MSTPTDTNKVTSTIEGYGKAAYGAAEGAVKAVNDTVSSAINGTQKDTPIQDTVKNVAKNTGDFLSDLWAKAKNGVKDLSAWEIGGMAGGALLAWVIGNAFGGGGILGTVISALLVIPMAMGGRDIFKSFDEKTSHTTGNWQPLKTNGPAQYRQRMYDQPYSRDPYYGRPVPRYDRYSSLGADTVPAEALENARAAGRAIQTAELVEGQPLPMKANESSIQRG